MNGVNVLFSVAIEPCRAWESVPRRCCRNAGARVCDPQRTRDRLGQLDFIEFCRLPKLLRVADPRSDVVSALGNTPLVFSYFLRPSQTGFINCFRFFESQLDHVPRLARHKRTAPIAWKTKLGIQMIRCGKYSGRVSRECARIKKE